MKITLQLEKYGLRILCFSLFVILLSLSGFVPVVSGSQERDGLSEERPIPFTPPRSWNYTVMQDRIGYSFLNESEVRVESAPSNFTKEDTHLVIPEEIQVEGATYTVVALAPGVFSNEMHLTSVSLPATLTTFGAGAFSGCYNLTTFTVSEDNPVFIVQNGLLIDKQKKELVRCPGGFYTCQIPEGITGIGDAAFAFCEYLKEIELPVSVIRIGKNAFASAQNLEYIAPLNQVQEIGEGAFRRTALRSCQLPSSLTVIEKNLFESCYRLEEINLPETTRIIGQAAFSYCFELKSIELPDSVQEIHSLAFQYCRSLEQVTLPASLTTLNWGAFEYCSALTQVTFSGGSCLIDAYVFAGCISLQEVRFLNQAPKLLATDIFTFCPASLILRYPKTWREDFLALDLPETIQLRADDGSDDHDLSDTEYSDEELQQASFIATFYDNENKVLLRVPVDDTGVLQRPQLLLERAGASFIGWRQTGSAAPVSFPFVLSSDKAFYPLFYVESRTVEITTSNLFSVAIEEQELNPNPRPINYRGRIYLPMRACFEAQGCLVVWDEGMRTATINSSFIGTEQGREISAKQFEFRQETGTYLDYDSETGIVRIASDYSDESNERMFIIANSDTLREAITQLHPGDLIVARYRNDFPDARVQVPLLLSLEKANSATDTAMTSSAQIYFDDVLLNLELLSYQASLYVSLRSLANQLQLDIDWNIEKQQIHLGKISVLPLVTIASLSAPDQDGGVLVDFWQDQQVITLRFLKTALPAGCGVGSVGRVLYSERTETEGAPYGQGIYITIYS